MKKKNKNTKKQEIFFDDHASHHQEKNILFFNKARKYEFDKIISHLELSSPKKIIEIGSGYGKYIVLLLKMGHHVTAVDISENSMRVLKNHAKRHKLTKKLRTRIADFSKPEFKNQFDIGLCISTYQVLGENDNARGKLFKNFIQSVKPGGMILLADPNPLNPLFYPFYLFDPSVYKPNMKMFFQANELFVRRRLKEMGLKKITVDYVGFLPIRFTNATSLNSILNDVLTKIPLINKFSSFIYYRADR